MSIGVFLVVWAVLGLAGFFTSIACFWYSSIAWSFIGLLMSVIMGPFYWIFFFIMREYKLYCSNPASTPEIVIIESTKRGGKKKATKIERSKKKATMIKK